MTKSTTDSNATNKDVKSGYAPVIGLKLYYEIHGTGEPLILLHGEVGGIEMFGPNLAAFSATRRAVAVDLQAHGRTADIDRPLSYDILSFPALAALVTPFLDTPMQETG